MTRAEFNSYRFSDRKDPTDAQLDQLMENAAETVRESNRISDSTFFATLRNACEEAKKRKRS